MNNIFKSVRRTPYQSLAAFLILFLTLFMALFFFHLTSFFYGFLAYLETKPQVTVYFKTETPESDILKLKSTIVNSGKSLSVKYVSREEALKIYRGLNKDNPLLLEMVSAEILPASLEIYAKKPAYLEEIANFLKKQPGVDEVNFQKNIINQLLSLTAVLRKLSLTIFIFLLVLAIMVLMTMTAFKIALRKDEFELLRYLGASRWYVRRPFLAEGALFGVVSATVAMAVFYGIFLAAEPFLKNYLVGIQPLPFYHLNQFNLFVWPPSLSFIGLAYILTLVFGVGIGVIGNLLSTFKYLK